MWNLINKTEYVADLIPFLDIDGAETVVAVVKATYTLKPENPELPLSLTEKQVPLTFADEYYGDPETSSLHYASDIVPEKQGTDVVMIGHAYAPHGQAEAIDVTLATGPLKKTIRVFGDRYWKKSLGRVSITSPQPFSTMPLIYERAFGGLDKTHKDPKKWAGEPRNPVGTGLVSNKGRQDLEEISLPNIEDPSALIKSFRDRPQPAGFGFVTPSWKPRLDYAGTYDEDWKENRYPLLPLDFDPRFYNSAHPDLISTEFFRGGELVRVGNASKKGSLSFKLPNVEVNAEFYIDSVVTKQMCRLDTVVIEPDEERFVLTWRTKVRCHRKLKYVMGAKLTSRRRVDGQND